MQVRSNAAAQHVLLRTTQDVIEGNYNATASGVFKKFSKVTDNMREKLKSKRVVLVADECKVPEGCLVYNVKSFLEEHHVDVQLKLLHALREESNPKMAMDILVLFGAASLVWFQGMLSDQPLPMASDFIKRTVYHVQHPEDIDVMSDKFVMVNLQHLVFASDTLYRKHQSVYIPAADETAAPPLFLHTDVIRHGVADRWVQGDCDRSADHDLIRRKFRADLHIGENDFVVAVPIEIAPPDAPHARYANRVAWQTPISAVNAYSSSSGHLLNVGALHLVLFGSVLLSHVDFVPYTSLGNHSLHVLPRCTEQSQFANLVLTADVLLVHTDRMVDAHLFLPLAMSLQVPQLLAEVDEMNEFVVHNVTGLLHSYDDLNPTVGQTEIELHLGRLDTRITARQTYYSAMGGFACQTARTWLRKSVIKRGWIDFLSVVTDIVDMS